MSIEDLEDIVQNSVVSYKNYGRNYKEPKHTTNKLWWINSCASRSKAVVEVWTPQQKEMLARVDEVINRPIKEC